MKSLISIWIILMIGIIYDFKGNDSIHYEKKIGNYKIIGQYHNKEKCIDTFTNINLNTLHVDGALKISPYRVGRWEYFKNDSLYAYTIYSDTTPYIQNIKLKEIPDSIFHYVDYDTVYTVEDIYYR